MHVNFNVHPFAMHVKGGGEVQLLKYVELLRARKVNVELHDIWDPKFSLIDIFHHFHMLSGSLPFLHYINSLSKPIVLSTNIWIDRTNSEYLNKSEIREYIGLSRRFITNSYSELYNIRDNIGCDVTHGRVVYNGVSEEYAVPVSQSTYLQKILFSGRYILNIANIEPRKNQLRLAEAAKQLQLPLVCIGNVRDYAYLEACRLTLPEFHYLGNFGHDDPVLRAAMQHAEVFALPSMYETPGLAALEAAVAGCKIVITSEGATQEYFDSLANYVDPQSVESIATGIESAFIARDRNIELRSHILSKYAWNRAGDTLVQHYAEIIEQET